MDRGRGRGSHRGSDGGPAASTRRSGAHIGPPPVRTSAASAAGDLSQPGPRRRWPIIGYVTGDVPLGAEGNGQAQALTLRLAGPQEPKRPVFVWCGPTSPSTAPPLAYDAVRWSGGEVGRQDYESTGRFLIELAGSGSPSRPAPKRRSLGANAALGKAPGREASWRRRKAREDQAPARRQQPGRGRRPGPAAAAPENIRDNEIEGRRPGNSPPARSSQSLSTTRTSGPTPFTPGVRRGRRPPPGGRCRRPAPARATASPRRSPGCRTRSPYRDRPWASCRAGRAAIGRRGRAGSRGSTRGARCRRPGRPRCGWRRPRQARSSAAWAAKTKNRPALKRRQALLALGHPVQIRHAPQW